MSSGDTNEPSASEPSEPTFTAPEPEVPTTPKSGWTRRSFLKAAAALGATTAGAGLVGENSAGGLRFGPLSAFANDLSTLPCTANDVNVLQGQIVPGTGNSCSNCTDPTGTFTAVVKFAVTNGASAGRYCITIHLPNGTDVILRDSLVNGVPSGNSDISGKSTKTMYGLIPGIPCSTTNANGVVCLGGSPPAGMNKCAPGTCATVAWSTSPGNAGCTTADQSPPGGQCRHQPICFTTFSASLACTNGASDCSPTCGGTASLTATVVAPDTGPFAFHLSGSDGSTQSFTGTAGVLSHTFTVSPPAGATTYTVKICDEANGQADLACCRTSNGVTLTVTPLGAPTLTNTKPACDGTTTVTAKPTGGTGPFSYAWTPVGGTQPPNPVNGPGTYTITLPQGTTTTVGVTVTDANGCTSSNSTDITVPAALAVSAAAGSPDCSGSVKLTATASGGVSPYTYQWFDGGTSIGTGSPLTVTLTPGDHSITVTVTDSANCTATSAPTKVHVNQPVATSLDTGGTPDCTGHLTFTASATGGTGTYTFAWAIDSTPVANNSTNKLVYPPTVDCAQHTVAVTATDSNGCVSGNTAVRFVTQVVTTTVA